MWLEGVVEGVYPRVVGYRRAAMHKVPLVPHFRCSSCCLCRQYTAPAVKERVKMFHPYTDTPLPEHQAYGWTKTQRTSVVPPEFARFRNSLDVAQIRNPAEKAVVFARHFQYQDKAPPQEYASGALQNLLRVIFTQYTVHHPHLEDLHVAFEPHIRATWKYKRQDLGAFGRPGTLITSRHPLPRFFDSSVYDKLLELERPPPEKNLGDLLSGLQNRPIYKEKISGGFFPGRSFPFNHTLLVVDHVDLPVVRRYRRSCTESRQLAERAEITAMHRELVLRNCLVHMYSLLLVQAVEKHGQEVIGTDLPEPESMQAVVTNGQHFTFIWYQLNTLDVSNKGKPVPSNLVAMTGPEMLYSKVEKKVGEVNIRALDFDQKVLRTIAAMILWK